MMSKRRCLDGEGVVNRGLVDGALFVGFLAKVSTKFDLIAHATDDRVAQRQQELSVTEGKPVGMADGVERSPFRCSIVVVVVVVFLWCTSDLLWIVRGSEEHHDII